MMSMLSEVDIITFLLDFDCDGIYGTSMAATLVGVANRTWHPIENSRSRTARSKTIE